MKTCNEVPNIERYSYGGAEPNPGQGGFGVGGNRFYNYMDEGKI